MMPVRAGLYSILSEENVVSTNGDRSFLEIPKSKALLEPNVMKIPPDREMAAPCVSGL